MTSKWTHTICDEWTVPPPSARHANDAEQQLADAPLPCPFCGEEAALYADDGLTAPYWVECINCLIRTDYFTRPDSAADHWNRRKTEPDAPRQSPTAETDSD